MVSSISSRIGGRASLPPLQDGLDRREQIVGLVLFHLHVRIPGHPEVVVRQQIHAREQLIHVRRR